MQSYINVRGESFKKRVLPDFHYKEIKGAHARIKYWLRKLVAFLFSQVGVGAFLMLYTVLGATIFIHLEASSHKGLLQGVESLRADVVNELWNVTHNYNVIYTDKWQTEVDLIVREFQKSFLQHVKRGYKGEKDDPWTFPKALIYSLSVYTTIGYGNLTPRTDWGKAGTCIYALIGIPLLLLYMACIGDFLAKSFIGVYVSMARCKLRLARFREERDETAFPQEENAPDHSYGQREKRDGALIKQMSQEEEERIPISTCLVVFCCYIVLGSIVFCWWEGWDYTDGSYFCFISLVTIGFGDFVPGQTVGQSAQQYVDGQLILCSIYILFGMGLMSTLFHLTQERFFTAARKLGRALHLI